MHRAPLLHRARAAAERWSWRARHPLGFLRAMAPVALSPSARQHLLRLLGRGDAWRRPPRGELKSTCRRWLEELRALPPTVVEPDPGDEAAANLPLVSVLIVSHHNPETTLLCLESLRRFTTYPHFEVVVVDNHSDAATRAVLEQAAAADTRIRIALNPTNTGFASGCNQAAEMARGSVLCLLNNDTVVTPGWLGTLTRAVLADPWLGMVGPSSGGVANEARVAAPYDSVSSLLACAERRRSEHAGRSFSIGMLAMFCTVLRRSVWEEIGPLDEEFGIGLFEDTDYSRRLRRAGYDLRCRRDVFVHHWQQAAFGQIDRERYRELYDRNWRYYKAKWSRSRGGPEAVGARGG